ncbi:glycosyltransferase family 4 protein [Aquimarina sp. 2201CG5-10]|uniref:glycosyltransferase family 4 protein n=1 Tax=Aquimarina callyspongiae TaxID=3098150 RepID=UPI002AB4B326|nr:glycosyltransferase family 4 protein [Aquimarina sp. 2201CG5-10]MDY8136890.1 glycosyltransferase family 4 protein [Aquimarina sp. 2201CG5-10]
MEILFVSSGNTKNGISPIVFNQGNSLKEIGHEVSFFTIKEKGIKGYFKHIFVLKRFLKSNTYDVIHAHYSLSAIVAALAGGKPLVVSLMGSDVKASPLLKYLIKICHFLFWKKVIVKSQDMKLSCGIEKASILPNGVDFNKFVQIPKQEALKITGWDQKKKHILFAANPNRREKNYALAQRSFELINQKDVELHALINVPNQDMPAYFNAADVVILTSLWEGSPNVIKEAMACNCKIVAVNVGDIKEIIGDAAGCFVTGFDEKEIANCLERALEFSRKPDGRFHIPHLNAEVIATKLTNLYKEVL